jgi:hypothetical protein
MATQWAFHGVPKARLHGRTRQSSGYHWNLVAFASGTLTCRGPRLAGIVRNLLRFLQSWASIENQFDGEIPMPCNSYRLSWSIAPGEAFNRIMEAGQLVRATHAAIGARYNAAVPMDE